MTEPDAVTGLPQDVPADQRLTSLMKRAALWSGLNSFALRLGQFAVGVASARIIAPAQFGVFAVALTVYTIVVNVNELGVSAALARTTRPVPEVAPTVATIAITSSAVFTAGMFFSAGPLSSAMGAPDAAPAVRVLSFVVLLGGVTAVPYALLVRNFQQRQRFTADGSNFLASAVVVVILGLAGWGAMALAVSKIVGQLLSTGLLVATIKPRYRPGWNSAYAREVLVYSLPLAAATVVEFTLGNVDYVVVGRVLGALALGFYMLAYNISGWPVSVFGLMINEVALPAFARRQDDISSLSRRVTGAFAFTCAIALPVSALCLVLAGPLVRTVYGERWSAAIGALAVLGLFGSFRIIVTLFSNILAALGRSRSVLTIQLVWITALVPALVVGVRSHGILGAALAQQAVAVAVVLPVALTIVGRATGVRVRDLTRAGAFPTAAAVVAAGAGWLVAAAVDRPVWQLLCGGTVGVAVHLMIVRRWMRRLLADARAGWGEPVPSEVVGGIGALLPRSPTGEDAPALSAAALPSAERNGVR